MTLAERFPHASASFLARNQALAAGVSDAQPKLTPRRQSVGADEAEETRPGRLTVRITRRGTRLLDKDNLFGSVKYVCDSLRYSGLIPEDNPEAIDLIVIQEKVKRSEVGTVIEILPQTPDTSR